MAKSKKHRMSKQELRAPDEVEVALRGFWEKLYKYRKLALAGVVVLVAAGVAVWVIGKTQRAGVENRSDALREATAAIGAPIGPEPVQNPRLASLPRPPRFDDEGARIAAANTSLTKFLGDHSGEPVSQLVRLAAANAKLNQGDAAGALADVEGWLGDFGSSLAVPVALELKARAQVAAGKLDDAKGTLDALSKAVGPGTLKALALTDLADLDNPVLHDGGDPAKAKASYEAALAALPPEPEDDQPTLSIMGKPGLLGRIENHLGLLP